jgi:hypothetical protein
LEICPLCNFQHYTTTEELKNMAIRIQRRAIKQCGKLLKEIEKRHGANQNISHGGGTKVATRKEAATDAGLSKPQAATTIRVSCVPEEEFNEAIESRAAVLCIAKAKKKSAFVPQIVEVEKNGEKWRPNRNPDAW